MIPFATDTVTLYHNNAGNWSSSVINGCSYRRIRRRVVIDSAATVMDETTCRIPAGGIMPASGDVVVLGVCREKITGELDIKRLLDKYNRSGAFRVQSVSDNARPGMPVPHYAATGA